jgi:sugar phosphate isomerase/epimerase
MKIGIDSYCYHRHFGEIYPGLESDPGSRMTMLDFLDRAAAHGVEGVSLESCFFSDTSETFLDAIKSRLDELNFLRVWAWGHPKGLGSGTMPEALDDLIRHIAIAKRLGAGVMRICAGGRATRPRSWTEHKAGLLPLLRKAAASAEQQGVILALENHVDLLCDEMLDLITTIDSPWLRVCLDTANNLRLFEDPIEVVARLAPYASATHVKDIGARKGDPREFGFWPSVPLGEGLVDIPEALRLLRKSGYEGLLALEIDFLDPRFEEEQSIAVSLDYLRKQRALTEISARSALAE